MRSDCFIYILNEYQDKSDLVFYLLNMVVADRWLFWRGVVELFLTFFLFLNVFMISVHLFELVLSSLYLLIHLFDMFLKAIDCFFLFGAFIHYFILQFLKLSIFSLCFSYSFILLSYFFLYGLFYLFFDIGDFLRICNNFLSFLWCKFL